jgi:hypothetical protein
MLVIQFLLVSLSLSLRAGRPRLTFFSFQLNQAIFSPLSLSDYWEIKLLTKTYNFRDVAPGHQENQSWHLLWDVFSQLLKLKPLNSPWKGRHFLSEEQQSFETLILPVLIVWWIINFISLSSKTLLSLFVNWHWDQRTSFLVTQLGRPQFTFSQPKNMSWILVNFCLSTSQPVVL